MQTDNYIPPDQIELLDSADDYCPDYIGDELWAEFERDNTEPEASTLAPTVALDSDIPHISERVRNYALAYSSVVFVTLYALELALRYF